MQLLGVRLTQAASCPLRTVGSRALDGVRVFAHIHLTIPPGRPSSPPPRPILRASPAEELRGAGNGCWVLRPNMVLGKVARLPPAQGCFSPAALA